MVKYFPEQEKVNASNVLRVDKLDTEPSYWDSLDPPSVLLSIRNRENHRRLSNPQPDTRVAKIAPKPLTVRRIRPKLENGQDESTELAESAVEAPAQKRRSLSQFLRPRGATRAVLVSVVMASVIALVATQLVALYYFSSTSAGDEQFLLADSTMTERELSFHAAGVIDGTTRALNDAKRDLSAETVIPTLRSMSEQIRDIHDVLNRIPQDSQRTILSDIEEELGRLGQAATKLADGPATHQQLAPIVLALSNDVKLMGANQ